MPITQSPNHLPLVTRRNVRFLGTAKCSEATPQCTSVGVIDTNDDPDLRRGDLVLADQDGRMFRIPADERLGVLMLIAQSVQP